MMDGLGNERSTCSSKHYSWPHNHKTEASTVLWKHKVCSTSDDKNSLHHTEKEVSTWQSLDTYIWWKYSDAFTGHLNLSWVLTKPCSCDNMLPNPCKLHNVVIYRSLFVPEK